MIQKYALIKENMIFDKKISKAQNINAEMAKKSYSMALLPYAKGYNIALHPDSSLEDSFEFSKNFDINTNINFFIGGAFGFEDEFLKQMDKRISLSKLTFSHKVAKVILFEQIYRALTIINKHPYHK